jgi:hypothetical protein
MLLKNSNEQIEWLEKVIDTLEKVKDQAKENTSQLDQCEYTASNSMPNTFGETEHRIDLMLMFTDKSSPPTSKSKN